MIIHEFFEYFINLFNLLSLYWSNFRGADTCEKLRCRLRLWLLRTEKWLWWKILFIFIYHRTLNLHGAFIRNFAIFLLIYKYAIRLVLDYLFFLFFELVKELEGVAFGVEEFFFEIANSLIKFKLLLIG